MKKIINPPKKDWETILKRPTQTIEAVENTVTSIFDDVKRNGDDGIKRYTAIFDGVSLDDLCVSAKEILDAENALSDELKQAIQQAKKAIEKFHLAQKTSKVFVETVEGVECWQEKRQEFGRKQAALPIAALDYLRPALGSARPGRPAPPGHHSHPHGSRQ